MSNIDISVIIPSYKPGDYIWECLDSLYNQTLDKSRFEVLLILNGCCEPWKSSILNWIKGHPYLHITFIQMDKGGVSNARNIGIDNANGEYIAFIDDDDYVSPSYLEDTLSIATDNSIVVTDSRAFIEGKNGWLDKYGPHVCYQSCAPKNDQILIHTRGMYNGAWMKLIPCRIIASSKFDASVSIGEDSLFMFQISRNVKQIKYASSNAIYYRRYREGSALTNRKSTSWLIMNCFKLQHKYISIWLKSPFKYNFIFFANRLLANVKGLFWHINYNLLSQ